MSLLMDALKRAEKAREQDNPDGARKPVGKAAEREAAADMPSSLSDTGLTLEPLPGEPDLRELEMLEETGIREAPAPKEVPADAFELKLDEALEEEGFALDDSREISLNDPKGYGPSPDEDYFPEDTSATLPSLKAARRSVDDYFDGTRPVPRVKKLDEDTTTTAQRQKVEDANRDTAKTVISVKQRPPSGRGRRYALFAVLPLIVLVGGIAGYYYYWTITASPKFVSADDPPAPQPPAPPTSVTQVPAPPTAVVQVPVPPPPSALPAPLPEASGSVPAGLAAIAAEPQVPAPAPPPDPVADAGPAEPPEPPAVPPAEPVDLIQAGEQLMQTALLPAEQSMPQMIRIAKKRVVNRVHPLLNKGYEAFQNGDLDGASSAYRRIIRQQPNNRDGLLGLAAVAAARNDFNEANRLYLKVLQFSPRDSVAQAALLTLAENLDPIASESRLKMLLDNEPDADYLHFALGNLYAGQQRWPESQAAYFKAYTQDPQNADYAFNLAVSLDHLSQRAAALQYYQRALELADSRTNGFQNVDVLSRIQSLSAASN